MSYNNRKASIKNLKEANKVIKKAQESSSEIIFRPIGKFEDLKILAHTDASYRNVENKTRSVAGRIIYLSDKTENKLSPLGWKSKTIPQVCKSAKAAETRALDMCCDDAIFVARIVNEVYTGQKGNKQIDLTVKCDNKGVKESLESTHQIEEKLMRPLIEHIKGLLSRIFVV